MGIAACAADETNELRRIAPDLPPELARHLIRSDDETLATFCLEYGYYNTKECWHMLKAFDVASDEEAAVVDHLVTPMLMRMPIAFSGYPDAEHVREWVNTWQDLTLSQKRELAHIHGRFRAVRDAEALDPETHEAVLNELIQRYREYPGLLDCGEVYTEYFELLAHAGRFDEIPAVLQAGIECALADNHHLFACQLLGIQGGGLVRSGDEAKVLESYYRGVAIARHCQPAQEARLLSFIGNYYARLGRHTLARELYRSAEEIARLPGARGGEIRYLYESLFLHVSLGCWEVVGKDLARLPALERIARRYAPAAANTWSRRVALVAARYHAATGAIARVERELKAMKSELDGSPVPGELENVLRTWSDILIEAGRYEDARSVIAEGIDRCARVPKHFGMTAFLLNQARVEYGLGNNDACRAALDEFMRIDSTVSAIHFERVQHDVLRARMADVEGDAVSYARWAGSVAERLEEFLVRTEVTPQGYTGVGMADFRSMLRTRVAGDPVAGYALELFWRQSRMALGREHSRRNGQRPLQVCVSISESGGNGTWRCEAAHLLKDLASLNATHCVYAVTEHDVIRWTAQSGVVSLDTLDVAPGRLMELVTRARAELTSPSGADRPSLVELSALLLPPLHGEPGSAPPLLLVSPEGPLADFPFEALPLPGVGRVPLIGRCDVAYVRGMPGTRNLVTGRHGLVVADPVAATPLKRNYPGLGRPLEHALEEALELCRLDPSAALLQREAASKPAVLEAWTQARYVYFAAHALQDPEIPYFSFIPMSSEPGNERHDSYFIDISDIRGADLSRCELVVLSGCSTGSGYQDHRVRAPALADAFLDAGCGAVVQTFWDVDDHGASRFMRDFIDAWAGDGVSPLRALNDVRRRWCEAGADPAVWAAYSIVLNRL